jgi:hypothetical protein
VNPVHKPDSAGIMEGDRNILPNLVNCAMHGDAFADELNP